MNSSAIWSFVVFDDQNEAQRRIGDQLRRYGPSEKITTPQSLESNFVAIRSAAIAVIDLSWVPQDIDIQKGFTNYSRVTASPLEASVTSGAAAASILARLVKERCILLQDGTDLEVEADQVGWWVAKLALAIQPAICPLLYSGNQAELVRLRAIGLWQMQTLGAADKRNPDSLGDEVVRLLRIRVRETLESREDIRSWFLANVLLPKALGIGEIINHDQLPSLFNPTSTIEFSEQTFLPFMDPATSKVSDLLSLLPSAGRSIPDWQRRGCAELDHSILHETTPEGLRSVALTAEARLGPLGQAIAAGIKAAAQQLEEDPASLTSSRATARRATRAHLPAKESDLWDLIKDQKDPEMDLIGTVDLRLDVTFFQRESDHDLPFSLSALLLLGEVLRGNEEKYKGKGHWRLGIVKVDSEFTWLIEYTNTYNFEFKPGGTSTWDTRIKESLQKGPHRGLPLALLFGLEHQANDAQYREHEGQRWKSLHGKTGHEPEFQSHSRMNRGFGLRWYFPMGARGS